MDASSPDSGVRWQQRKLYEEAYAERKVQITARYNKQDDSGEAIPYKLTNWLPTVSWPGWSPPRFSSGLLTFFAYTTFVLLLIWAVLLFFQSRLFRKLAYWIHYVRNYPYSATARTIQETVFFVYYRLRYSFVLAEASRRSRRLMQIHPLRLMLFLLGLMEVNVLWKMHSPKHGISPGEQTEFRVPYYMRNTRREGGSSWMGNPERVRLVARTEKRRSDEQAVKVDQSTSWDADTAKQALITIWQTSTVIESFTTMTPCTPVTTTVEAFVTITPTAEVATVTSIEKRTITEACEPSTSTVSATQVSTRAHCIENSTSREPRTTTVTETQTELWTRTERPTAPEHLNTDPLTLVPEHGKHYNQDEVGGVERGVGDSLVWCSLCQQRHCCELPY